MVQQKSPMLLLFVVILRPEGFFGFSIAFVFNTETAEKVFVPAVSAARETG